MAKAGKKSSSSGIKRSKDVSPLRRNKILELKSEVNVIKEREPGIKLKPLLFELFKNKRNVDEGYSLKELAYFFYPGEKEYDPKTKKEKDEPHSNAIKKMRALLLTFRNKWKANKSVKVYAASVADPVSGLYFHIYYRMDEVRKTKTRQKRMVEVEVGVKEAREDLNNVASKSKRELQRLDQEMTTKIRQKTRKKQQEQEIYT